VNLSLKRVVNLLQTVWVAVLGQQDSPVHTLQKGLAELGLLGIR